MGMHPKRPKDSKKFSVSPAVNKHLFLLNTEQIKKLMGFVLSDIKETQALPPRSQGYGNFTYLVSLRSTSIRTFVIRVDYLTSKTKAENALFYQST